MPRFQLPKEPKRFEFKVPEGLKKLLRRPQPDRRGNDRHGSGNGNRNGNGEGPTVTRRSFALGAAASLEKQYRVLAGVTLGTGLGVGVVLDGRLYDGPHCGVGEIGALPYEGLDYEAFCSKKFFHARGVDPMGAAEAAKAGDREALELFREFGVHLGTFLSVVMFAYDPDCIVLGGGIAHSFPLFMDSMWDTLREKYPYRKNLEDLSILAMPEEEIALVGAASL